MDSEIRKDYFTDNYVIIAPKRNKRPDAIQKIKDDASCTDCHFCPDNIDQPTILRSGGKGKNWKVLVLPNKFPALTLDNHKAFGKQEVIIETPEHNKEINELSLEHIEEILDVYISRFETLRNTKGIKYVLVFKNEGGKAGASMAHSHSQIVALPIVPPMIKGEYQSYANYYLENNTCPYCDIIKNEKKEKTRVIFEDENLFVLSPFASNAPYGAWFIPKRHFRLMSEMTVSEKQSFAKAMKKILGKLDSIDYPYNYFFHNAVNSEDYHMHMKLAPRPNIWAGVELGTGVIINAVPPEDAAKFYRE